MKLVADIIDRVTSKAARDSDAMRRIWILAALVACGVVAYLAAGALRERPSSVELRTGAPVERAHGAIDEASLPAPRAELDSTPRVAETARVELEVTQSPQPTETSFEEPLLEVNAVSRERGAPIVGARVRLRPLGEPERTSWSYVEGSRAEADDEMPLTDEDGRAWIQVRAGIGYGIVIELDDESAGAGRAEIDTLADGEHRVVLVELITEFDLLARGRVFEQASGTPVPGARVRVHLPRVFWGSSDDGAMEPRDEGETIAELETDAAGEFQVRTPSWRHVLAFVDADGFGPRIIDLCAWRSSAGEVHEVPLARAARLELFVTDARASRVDELEARIVVDTGYTAIPCTEWDWPGAMPREWRVKLDGEGRATFEGLPPDAPLQVELLRDAEREWFERDGVQIEPGETRRIELTLVAGSRVRGRLIDAGDRAPLPDRELWLIPGANLEQGYVEDRHRQFLHARVETNETGDFNFEDVATGDWWIAPAPITEWREIPGPEHLAPIARFVHVSAGGGDVVVEFEVHRGIYLDGVVLDDAGQPTKARVEGTCSTGGWIPEAKVGSDGRFRAGPLAPGTYEVRAWGGGLNAVSLPVIARTEEETRIVLRLRSGAKLSGILAVDGRRAERDAEVLLVRRPDESSAAAEMGWESWLYAEHHEAEFSFDGLLPGTYDVVVTTVLGEVGYLRDIRLDAGHEVDGLELELGPGATLELVTATSDEWRRIEVSCQGRLWCEAWVAKEEPDVVTLLPGLTNVRVMDAEDRLLVERTVSLVAGERVTLEIP